MTQVSTSISVIRSGRPFGARGLAFAFVVALLSFAPAVAQVKGKGEYGPTPPPLPEDDDGKRPRLSIENDAYNWGEVQQGETIEHTFVVENTGDALLRITRVKPGCGCTTESFDREIQPGSTGRVTLTLDSTKLRGAPTKFAEIFSNDARNPRFRVTMSGKVKTLFDIEPRSVRMSGLVGQSLSTTATIVSNTGTAFSVKSLTPARNRVQVVGRRQDEKGNIVLDLEVAASNRVSPPFRDSIAVELELADGKIHKMNLPVMIEHRNRVHIPQRQAYFLARETDRLKNTGTPVSKQITVEAGGEGITFAITKLELAGLPEDAFELSHRALQDGTRYVVEIKLTKYIEDQKFLRGRLIVHTDDPEASRLETNISAQFTPKRQPRAGVNREGAKGQTGFIPRAQPRGGKN